MSDIKVGYLGPTGTFTEEATQKMLTGNDVQLVAFSTNTDVLEAVQSGCVERGVVPIENSIEGSVPETINWIAHKGNIRICAETDLPVTHHLLGKPGGTLSNISKVMSHSHAVAQCREFLRDKLPGVQVRFSDSTADAARLVAESSSSELAAIGTKYAADIYGLDVYQSDIQDERENFTRFILVGATNNIASERRLAMESASAHRKTSLLVILAEDHPGALYQVLAIFAREDINLTRIESRPTRRKLGSYHFFIDCEGDESEEKVRKAICDVEATGCQVRLLGSYPVLPIISPL